MKTITNFRKICFMLVCAAFMGQAASATVFTAFTSGNFNDPATWGGAAPAAALSSDVVIIPYGITVTLTENQSFTGTASLLVNGILTSEASPATLTLNAGNLSGNGSVLIDNLVVGYLASLTFGGLIVADNITSYGPTSSAPASIAVTNKLTLAGGTLLLTTGSLTMGPGATIEMAGGKMKATGSGAIDLDNTYNVRYLAPATPAGIELTGYGLTHITVNTTGRVKLSTDLALNGTLDLTAGILDLNGHNLTFGPVSGLADGGGKIASSASSNIVISTHGGLSGPLNFVAGENVVNSLMLFMGDASNTTTLGSDIKVTNTLSLSKGKLVLGPWDVTLTEGALINYGSSESYVVTNGGGKLYMRVVPGIVSNFAVGTMDNYAPISVTPNDGSESGYLNASVTDKVYVNGMSGAVMGENEPMVHAMWQLATATTMPVNYTISTSWSADMETQSFLRNESYLSHYTGGAWDVGVPLPAAQEGNMYSVTRTGIQSLSPFMVASNKMTNTVPIATTDKPELLLYPNPATNVIYYTGNVQPDRIDIFNLTGTKVKTINGREKALWVENLPAGEYIASFVGQGVAQAKRFTKQ